ncbi:hepatocyte growth factor-like [Mercenaria mercenaria]|uniref:hepatocyte growth factor-like n=1 Tax=Mercenaria mercenaria TaxID=6596 RepID=UPI00234E999E|nr:hepatocyte growth factor-like [Mercenaria mercenaria]
MSLVSMLSLSEMRFIKYLLRERRYLDGHPSNFFDAEFYVHIGLSLGTKFSYEVPIWENGFYATYFTARNRQKVSTGNCTRMNFKLFDDDFTWEYEDCEYKLAEYTMCEYRQQGKRTRQVKSLSTWVDTEIEVVPEQVPASEYNSNINTTVSGKKCKDSQCEFSESLRFVACVNIDGIWEECSINLPTRMNSSKVYYKYLGNQSTSFSGKICQRWDVKYPHNHDLHGNLFKGEGISDASNYCRDPVETGYLWCFTTDADTRWEPCLLNEIKAKRYCTTKSSQKYTGNRNTTITGKACQRWDKQDLKNADFPKIDLTDASNYCRDPYGFGYDWCYIEAFQQDQTWEPCQINEIEGVELADDIVIEIDNTSDNALICDNGRVIQSYFKCDGKFDCKDHFDEIDCVYSGKFINSEFHCCNVFFKYGKVLDTNSTNRNISPVI